MSKVTITVDDRELEADAGEMLIRVTDRNDIYIPRFCYHDKLSIAANCRMCLVEVERAPKPLPACATPVMDGMKVFTRSKLAQEAQAGTMEFLLINHPLDCPVCDQGGECPLQDQAMGYGKDESRFMERKRSVPSGDIGPLVATEMTRCIHCTRCVRFGEEVAGVMEMGAPGRGENVKISTFLSQSIDSEVSGNIIDLCPVGALTSKPYRFAARSWEMRDHASISPHDCVGTNINIQTLRDQVERVLPIENPDINECWLADRDRFSYEAVNSEQRLTAPMIREDGSWRETDWETALRFAASGIQTVVESGSADDVGALAAGTSTLEEFYLLQKLARTLGSHNVDHRLQQGDFRDDDIAPAFPASEVPVRRYGDLGNIVLVGSNIRKEQPLLSLRIREGSRAGRTNISAINPVDYDLNFDLCESSVGAGFDMIAALAGLAKSLAYVKSRDLPTEISNLAPDNTIMAETAKNVVDAGEDGVIILGALAQQHPDASLLRAITAWISGTSGCKVASLAPANSAAGWLANCVPGDQGMNAGEMLERGRRAFILLGTEPELDSINGKAALEAMRNAKFVVQLSPFRGGNAMDYADVLLPMAAFAEAAGTFVNCEGRNQKANVAAPPMGESRPAWKILRVLGNFLELDGFDYITLEDVGNEVESECRISSAIPLSKPSEWRMSEPLSSQSSDLTRIAEMPMYRGDVTLRNAAALQHTADNPAPAASVHPDTINRLGLEDAIDVEVRNGSGKAVLPLQPNARIPENAVYVPAGFDETTGLGGHVEVTLKQVDN